LFDELVDFLVDDESFFEPGFESLFELDDDFPESDVVLLDEPESDDPDELEPESDELDEDSPDDDSPVEPEGTVEDD